MGHRRAGRGDSFPAPWGIAAHQPLLDEGGQRSPWPSHDPSMSDAPLLGRKVSEGTLSRNSPFLVWSA